MTRKTVLQGTALGISAGVASAGLFALLAPRIGAALFGLPVKEEEDLPWIQAAGARDVAIAALSALALTSRRRRAAGVSMLALATVPVADCILVSQKKGCGLPSFMHGGSAACIAFLGCLLLKK